MAEKTRTTRTLFASAILAASGAWTAGSPLPTGPQSASGSLLVSYTRGGAGGAVALRVETSVDGVVWYLATMIDGTVSASAPYGRVTVYVQELRLAAPADGDALRTEHAIDLSRAAFVRVSAAEYGNTAAPGTLEVLFVEGL